MTRFFIFDVDAALSQLKSSKLSPVSQSCRLTDFPKPGPTENTAPRVSPGIEDSFPMVAPQAACPITSVSQMSPLSPPPITPSDLSEDAMCQFEERAAILEYEGGLDRRTAEAMARDLQADPNGSLNPLQNQGPQCAAPFCNDTSGIL